MPAQCHPARTALAVLGVLVTLLGVAVMSAPAASAAPVSAAHPFSDAVYLPLHSAFGVDCVRNNPGCPHAHPFWGMDVVPAGQFGAHGKPSHAGVFAMGAGIVHFGDAHGSTCGHGSSYGTWIWIDHGAGSLSRYGHLSRITVRNGAYVAAGQQIGVVGTTGKNGNCRVNYLDFQLQRHGLSSAHTVEFTTLRACVGRGAAQTWPSQAKSTEAVGNPRRVRYATWNAVHQGTQFPASNDSCVRWTVPATPATPTGVQARHSGPGRVAVSWHAPAPAYRPRQTMVELSLYHPGAKHWDKAADETYRAVPPNTHAVAFTGLGRRHTFRARVSFRNGTGWSHASAWRTVRS